MIKLTINKKIVSKIPQQFIFHYPSRFEFYTKKLVVIFYTKIINKEY